MMRKYPQGDTYIQHVLAPFTPQEREMYNYLKKCLRYLFTFIGLICSVILFYIYKTSVVYKMQFQIVYITKRYFWIDSIDFLYVIVLLMLVNLLYKRLWFSLFNLFVLWCGFKFYAICSPVDLYFNAYHNGIVAELEAFDYNICVYCYKTLAEWQKHWVVREECVGRLNSTSFTIYNKCYAFWEDPYIREFFCDFRLDYSDSDSFERIRNQIDKYQRSKIQWAQSDMRVQDLEYRINHPVISFCKDMTPDVTAYELLTQYPMEIFVGVFATAVLCLLIYHNFYENPFWKDPEPLYYRWIPESWIKKAPTSTPTPVADPIVDAVTSNSNPVAVVDAVTSNPVVKPYVESMVDTMIRSFPDLVGVVSNETCLYNLRSIIFNNQETIKSILSNLETAASSLADKNPITPEMAHYYCSQVLPKLIQEQKVCLAIIDKMKDMNSPFEQFEVIILQRISLFGLDFSFSNLTLYLVLAFVVILGFSSVIRKSLSLIPNYWQSVIEIFYSFIFSMLIDQAGKKAKVFFPAIFSLFFFILVSNLLGLIPLSFAVTSHVVITFCLGFGFFVAWIIVAFKIIGLKIFNIFWPTNVPLWLRPLLMVVEILSFSLRPLSLSIRLFVNILAGHILLHLVAGSVVLVFSKAAIFSFVPFVLLLAVFCLELGIAFLQAYIFSILLCIYLHDSYHVHGH